MHTLHLFQKDSWLIDYQASLNCLEAARAQGAQHYVLLSAICVQKPLLEFQRAKLAMEKALKVPHVENVVHDIIFIASGPQAHAGIKQLRVAYRSKCLFVSKRKPASRTFLGCEASRLQSHLVPGCIEGVAIFGLELHQESTTSWVLITLLLAHLGL